ncbi:MAG: efflux RND transporter periplasmic adaptor subunit [Anaerolineae bacterium]|nr:efflux RND transporter periplasmic adaptor subunit [Anaerolineae bacterium]
MKRVMLYVVLGGIVVTVVVGVVVWRRSPSTRQPEQELRSTVVERGTMLVAVSASGSVEPQARVSLACEVVGRIAEVAVEVADMVEAGDVLVCLDTTDLDFAVQQSEINLSAARLRLEQIQEPPNEADIEVARAAVSDAAAAYEVSKMNLTVTEHSVSVGDEVRAARLARDETFRTYQDMQAKADRHHRFVDDDIVAMIHDAYLDALGRYNRAVENAELQLTNARNEVTHAYHALQQAQDNLDELLEGASEMDIEAAQLDVDAAELSLEKARSDLEKVTLRAPFDGVVAAVDVMAGEMASTGLPAVTLLDTSEFRITVSVDEMDVGRLTEGQTAQVTLDALPDIVITGTIEYIAPAATLEGGVVYYDVIIGLAPTDGLIRVDMTANATIIVEELADVLVIPTWVVRVDRSAGQTYVDRQVGEHIERVDVELGVRHEGVVHVLGGLSEGDVVVWVESASFDFGRP